MKSGGGGNDRPVVLTFFPEHIHASGGKALSEARARNTVIKNELRAGRSYFLGEEVTVPLSRPASMFTRRNFGRVSTFKCRLR